MRTWDDNRNAINQLWSQCEWTEEERRLMHDDLGSLDQDVLYDAIRNVKRNYDTLYPQLKWFRSEYRVLDRLRKLKQPGQRVADERQPVHIDSRQNERMKDELKLAIESATPGDYQFTVDLVADKAARCEIELATAIRLVNYLNERLGIANGGRIGDAA